MLLIGQFTLLLCGVLAVSFGVNRSLIRSDVYTVDAGTNTIILGDSHAVYAFNPTLIPGSENVALEGESYSITYLKLRKILSENAGVEKIVLAFSPHHISEFNDRKFSDYPWKEYVFDKYYPLLSRDMLKEFEVDWKRYLRSCIQNSMVPNRTYLENRLRKLLGIGNESYPYVGGFVSITGSVLGEHELTKRLERHFGGDAVPLGVSRHSTSSLERMVALAHDEGKLLYLVGTPLHPAYVSRIPREISAEYERLRSQLARESHVRVCTFEAPPPTDTYLYDFDHVNQDGAAWVSSSISRFLLTGVDDVLSCE